MWTIQAILLCACVTDQTMCVQNHVITSIILDIKMKYISIVRKFLCVTDIVSIVYCVSNADIQLEPTISQLFMSLIFTSVVLAVPVQTIDACVLPLFKALDNMWFKGN